MLNRDTDYVNVFCRNLPEPVYGYRSGLTVYEERFLNDTLIAGGWNAAGYPLDVLSSGRTFIDHTLFKWVEICDPSVFHVELDGQCVDYMLEIKDFQTVEMENGSKESILTLKSKIMPAEIEVHTLLDGTPVLTRWLAIKNNADRPMRLSRLSVFCGALQQMKRIREKNPEGFSDDIYEIGYFDDPEKEKEGDIVWKPLPRNKTAIGGRFSEGRFRHPAFFLKNKLNGEIFFGQMEWSGGYEISIGNLVYQSCSDVTITLDMAITGFSPLRVIEPGEYFVSPRVCIGSLFGTVDDAVNAMYDHIRKSVLNLPEASGDACLVGSGMGPEHDMSVETTKRFVDQMADCGAELFIVDAGWFCPPGQHRGWFPKVGNWYPDQDRYPNGINEIVDYVHGKGMKFGLWMEPERIGCEAPIYEEHKDWYVTTPFWGESGGFLDMTNPDAAAWAEAEIVRVIESYKLDLLRIDYNLPSVYNFYFNNNAIPEGGGVKHFEAVYAMYERLKKRFPKVIFEGCAAGGGRTDLGFLKYFNHTWVSDCQIAPRSLYITNGMTMALPPERVDRLVGGMGSHAHASLDFQMRNAMFGHMTLNVFSPAAAEWNTQQLGFIKHSVKLYKDFIRPMLPTARMYHHTIDTKTARRETKLIMELASRERDKAVIGVFALPNAETKSITVYPRGIDFSREYTVTFDNTGDKLVISGRELMSRGITTLPLSAMTSALILIEAV
ncbi:MAG: alpha-galactosidase [Ruminococcaceae bacterium]|nr:alpha-galactosidase [Oscillospiraceae bacterium]